MKRIKHICFCLVILVTQFLMTTSFLSAGETKWIAVGRLHDWYHSAGCEVEIGRTYLVSDQQDGLRWPGQLRYQDMKASKGLWIGTTNYADTLFENTVFDHKVVHIGPRHLDETNEFMTEEFRLIGKSLPPQVLVNGSPASRLNNMENLAEEDIDETIVSDRMIHNVVHTSIGITLTRNIYAWSQQNHDDYVILDYFFKNTGIFDNQGSVQHKVLTDVVFYWLYRYAPTREPGPYGPGGYWVPQSSSWGHATMNDAVSSHPLTEDLFRCLFSWYGEHSQWAGPGTSIGAPWHSGDGHFGSVQFVGTIVLHADTSPDNPVNDPNQPTTTYYIGSDDPLTMGNDQFDAAKMTQEYAQMTKGYPELTQAQEVFDSGQAANVWGNTPGGFSQAHGFGPYTMAPGDSVRIVIAEAVSGLSREQCYELGQLWLDNISPFTLPDGGTTSDREEFKNAWVYTGRDSLFNTFLKAQETFDAGYQIPDAPPPPDEFTVVTGDEHISLSWLNNAESWTNFGGYKIYRTSDLSTKFDLIFSCGYGTGNPVVNMYDDTETTHGVNYYYSITSFDDGTTSDEILESGPSYTQTFLAGQLTSLQDEPNGLPDTYQLFQNYPNPFNPITKINYELPNTNYVDLSIYNALGQRVVTLVAKSQPAGRYSVDWDASGYASGVYYYRLKAEEYVGVKKMILLR